ncbi:Gfo/Idh/MocA family protein [Massiliimalia timonensis]|uniref:Gfo/Idh/MocA family protein n=1 Tax=Massiliimalia timonensis TaxID=1987501 RepID=UPI00189EF688|nr:Gfo/Idh/MocA family oxidoreductase [Massiliimalia timonensis]
MAQNQAKFGIIGLGRISQRFAKVLNTCDQALLWAVAAREQERADSFAKEYGAKRAYGNYLDLMNDPEIEIVYIGLTHNFHYEVVKQCLEHGKAVLCEKPMVLTKWEAEDLAACAEKNQVLLMEAMWTRCLPASLKTKEWLKAGAIGEVRYLDVQFSFHVEYDPEERLFNPALAGGALYDAGVYPLEYAYDVMGGFSENMHSMHTLTPNGLDSFDVITMQYGNGAIAHMVCGISLNTISDAYIYGENGHIIVRDFLRGKRCELYNDQNELLDFYEEEAEDGFIYQIRHAAELVKNQKLQSPYIPWQDSIACSELFERLMREWKLKE